EVKELHRRLLEANYNPWMDKVDILPGEQWRRAIEQAVRDSDFFIVCLSTRSANKRSFLQREIKIALDLWQEKLSEDIYLIPVRLEPCEAPEQVADFNWMDLFDEEDWPRLIEALKVGMERR